MRKVDGGTAALDAEQPDWRQRLIESKAMQNTLRILVVLGVGAIMGDGVLTPVSSLLRTME